MPNYRVFKLVRYGQWEAVSDHESLDEAEQAARKLCRSKDIETEPGEDLPRKYFGVPSSKHWKSMIERVEGTSNANQ